MHLNEVCHAFSHRKYNRNPLDCFCAARKCNFTKGKQNCCPRRWILLGVWTSMGSLLLKHVEKWFCSNWSTNVLLHSQVLFKSPSKVMGHIIQSLSSTRTERTPTELLCCLQEMPDKTPANTCYTAGQWGDAAARHCGLKDIVLTISKSIRPFAFFPIVRWDHWSLSHV